MDQDLFRLMQTGGTPVPAGIARLWRRAVQRGLAAAAAATALAMLALPAAAVSETDQRAIASWAAPMVSAAPSANNRVNNQTLRQIARISIGGDRVRVKLSNRWNPQPLDIGGASIALRTNDQNIAAASIRELTFGGAATITIPAGAEMLSDWVSLQVAAQAELAVDIYIPGDTSATGNTLTVRNGALQTNYLSGSGKFTGALAFPVAASRTIWQFMAAVDVATTTPRTAGIVAFGDSITEGLRSTLDANRRWPDQLVRRIVQSQGPYRGVVNLGISGNRVGAGGGSTNPSALSRLDSDALVQTGARHVIVLLGINDISGGATADDVIANLRQLIVRAHTQQLKIYGGTLTPFGNAPDAREAFRLAVNDFIRNSREFDGVVDFDAALRDPANPRRMLPQYDSGDTLHPSDAGYEAMGNAVNLSMFGVDQ